MKFLRNLFFIFTLIFSFSTTALANNHDTSDEKLSPQIKHYIDKMGKKYNFNRDYLTALFKKAHANLEIIDQMQHPYEKKSWPQYRNLFFTQKRVKNGDEFWREHKKILQEAEKKYGVPANIIVSIIGVETNYGHSKGTYPVFETLSTLAFYYKPRAKFFKKELTHYLLLTREQHLPPFRLKGSYAGAIGIPQFMPSVYRRYAVDYKQKGSADLDNNINDAIFSIANYLSKMGWKTKQPIAISLQDKPTLSKKLLSKSAKPRYSLKTLKRRGVKLPSALQATSRTKGAIIALDMGDKNKNNYWLTFANFRAIMRYNPRINYAMIVYQLGEAIDNEHKSHKLGVGPKATSARQNS